MSSPTPSSRHPKLTAVRQRYRHSCGYCGVTDIATGSELTLDHFRPLAAGGSDDDENLVYACIKCNQFKHDFWPDEEDQAAQRRVLHPLLDDLNEHVAEDIQSGKLYPLTETGRFHIALLRLNRPQLIEHRLGRHLEGALQDRLLTLEEQNAELRKTIATQKRYIAMLEAQLKRLK